MRWQGCGYNWAMGWWCGYSEQAVGVARSTTVSAAASDRRWNAECRCSVWPGTDLTIDVRRGGARRVRGAVKVRLVVGGSPLLCGLDGGDG